ncbi:unnamed protein product [Didymodactylos carnosus]|nr:unnamed protein product [Didymodactylos carnosus]CAF4359502.1 unnamed protein product [Didymodactylos carnosus]
MIVPRTAHHLPAVSRFHPRDYVGATGMYGDYDDLRIALRVKHDELEMLRNKLKCYEKIIQRKDLRIQELESKFDKTKSKRADH